MEESLSEKIIKNTLFNAAGRFWTLAVGLLLTPYIISRVGLELYGIWAFAGVLTGYFALLDFGVGASFVRYISGYHARKDIGSISRLVSTGTMFYLLLSVLLVPLVFPAMGPLTDFFGLPPGARAEATFVLRAGVVIFFLSGAAGAFQAVQTGLQRMDITNAISAAASLPLIAGTIYALENGHGLRGLILVSASVAMLTGGLNAAAAYRLLPGLRVSPRLASMEMFRTLFGFGFKLQFSRVADLVVFQADRLLIAYFLNVGAVGLYQLGSTVAMSVRQVPLLLVSALLPAASDLDARSEHQKLSELYLRGSKYLALTGVPAVFFAISAARPLMQAWMGPGYEDAALVVQLLGGGYLVNLLAGAGTSVGAAKGRPEFQMRAAIISGVSNLLLCAVLIQWLGFAGAALAAAVSLVLGPLYFFGRLHALLGVSTAEAAKRLLLPPLLAAGVPAALFLGLNYWLSLRWPQLGRTGALALLAGEGLLFAAAYAAVVLRAGCLDAYDRGLAGRLLALMGARPGGAKC